jgi:hypothetical protein
MRSSAVRSSKSQTPSLAQCDLEHDLLGGSSATRLEPRQDAATLIALHTNCAANARTSLLFLLLLVLLLCCVQVTWKAWQQQVTVPARR